MLICGFHDILPKTNFNIYEKVTLAQKETTEIIRQKRDDQNKILRSLPVAIRETCFKEFRMHGKWYGKDIRKKCRQPEEQRKGKIKEKSVGHRQFLRLTDTLLTHRILAYSEGPTRNCDNHSRFLIQNILVLAWFKH